MYINEILDVDKLDEHIRNQYITARRHPHLPLTVLNYTPKTQLENLWDDVTTRCRGLIVDNSGFVVANCMHKFFNYGQSFAENISLEGPVQVTDKLDGSMGLITFYEDELIVATRGSFESNQAKFAYDHIMNEPGYLDAFRVACAGNAFTAIVEIIYPDNRIVVDYGSMEDVVLIGFIGNEEFNHDKQIWIPADEFYSWPGPKVHKFSASSFEEALRIPPRENAEGIVVYFENTGVRLKIKQEDYMKAHFYLMKLSPKSIWHKICFDGKTTEEILSTAPDEFHDLVKNIIKSLEYSVDRKIKNIKTEYLKIIESLPDGFKRIDFVNVVKDNPMRDHLYLMLDNRWDELVSSVWKSVRP